MYSFRHSLLYSCSTLEAKVGSRQLTSRARDLEITLLLRLFTSSQLRRTNKMVRSTIIARTTDGEPLTL